MKKTFRRIAAFISTAVMAVSCGAMTTSASEATASLSLTDAKGIAGQSISVDVVLDTDNMCNGYDIDVTFDDRLELKNVTGCFATETNDNVTTIINFTGSTFKDGKAVSTLTFNIPKDAKESDTYDLEITRVGNFCFNGGEFISPELNNATIGVLEEAKPVTNHLVYVYEEKTVVALRGDVNNDGKVDLYDTIEISKNMACIIKLDGANAFFADVNQDGKIDLYDAIAICRYGISSDKNNAWASII